MAKTVKRVFEPRRIDDFAEEVEEGWVRVEGLEKLIPLAEYERHLEKEEESIQEATRLGLELKVLVRDYLRVRLPYVAFQEGCRKLSYALPAKVKVKGAPFSSAKSYHDEYHQTHFVRACIAVANAKEPTSDVGTPPEKLCFTASSEEEVKRERARMYANVYESIPTSLFSVKEEFVPRNGSIQYLEEKILKRIEEIEKRLDILEGSAKKRK
jgi:hypothetical protein